MTLECDSDHLRRAVAVLSNIEIRLAGAIGISVIKIRSVEQDHYVGVLLQAAALTKIRKHGPLVRTLLGPTIELGEGYHRHIELLGQQLELPGELRDLQLPRFHLLARGHELNVVDDHQLELMPLPEPPGLRSNLHDRQIR